MPKDSGSQTAGSVALILSDEVTTMKHSATANSVPAFRTDVKSISVTALFAAVIFLGIQSFRIPLPAAVGTPFLHFGHIFVMMAVLCLGAKRSTVAGVLGLVIFDILNGYLHSIPGVFVGTVIKCMLVGTVYELLKKKADGDSQKEYVYAVGCAALYGVTNIVVDFIWSVGELLLVGNTLGAAVAAEIVSIPATVINACFTVIGTAILYKPVVMAYRRAIR